MDGGTRRITNACAWAPCGRSGEPAAAVWLLVRAVKARRRSRTGGFGAAGGQHRIVMRNSAKR